VLNSVLDFFRLLKASAIAWFDDGCPRLGAALAFYTIFSLAPVLIIGISVASFAFGQDAVQGHVVAQIQNLVGQEAAFTIQGMIENAHRSQSGVVATLLGIVTLLIGATAVFGELQDAFNIIWRSEPRPRSFWLSMLISRLLSFSLVIALGFLMLASLIASAGISAFSGYLQMIAGATGLVLSLISFGTSFALLTVLFALLFRVLPSTAVTWRGIWLGSVMTTILFSIGKFLIGLYLGNSAVASSYGAAGSLVVILIWIYYSAQILLFGAEFTRLYSTRCVKQTLVRSTSQADHNHANFNKLLGPKGSS
jgi:membrane protein